MKELAASANFIIVLELIVAKVVVVVRLIYSIGVLYIKVNFKFIGILKLKVVCH